LTELQRGQGHVWTLPVSRAGEPGVERLRAVLSDQEKLRSERISDAPSRLEYLAAHILVHKMLAHFSAVAAADWHFVTGPQGRPEPAPGIDAKGLRFNLSHTSGLVACALSKDDAIGVDVEWQQRTGKLDAIAEKKFSSPELAFYKSASAEDRRRIFFAFWTLKEAYIKAIGKGLREPLDGFAFETDPLSIAFLHGQDDADCWRFDLFDPAPDYRAAVALARPMGAPVEIFRRHLDWPELEAL